MSTIEKTLIVMAVPQESDSLIETIAEKNNFKLFYTGIGLLAAAQKTSEMITKHQPARILNLGTAGSRHFNVGQLLEVVEFKNRTPYVIPMLNQIYKVDQLTNLTKAVCGSADFIDYSEKASSYDVLDMEAYALAYVCHQMKIKFNSIKYVTDDSKGDVGVKWREHLKTGAKVLSNQLDQMIKTKVLT